MPAPIRRRTLLAAGAGAVVAALPATDARADASGPAWRLTFIDFGMMGEVPSGTRRGLRRAFIAAAGRDGKGLVDAIRDVGAALSLPQAEIDAVAKAFPHIRANQVHAALRDLPELRATGMAREAAAGP